MVATEEQTLNKVHASKDGSTMDFGALESAASWVTTQTFGTKTEDSKADGSSGAEGTASTVPSVDADLPLPTGRACSKLICRVIDDDAYGRASALHTLHQFEAWALSSKHTDTAKKQYISDFVLIGGVRATLCYLQDHLDNCESAQAALGLLVAMCTVDHASVAQKMVEHNAVCLLLKAFQVHALQKNVTDLIDEELLEKAKAEEAKEPSLWKMMGLFPAEARDDAGCMDFVTCSADASMSEERKAMLEAEELSAASLSTALLVLQALQLLVPYAKSSEVSKIFAIVCKNISLLTNNEHLMLSATTTLVTVVKETRSSRIVIDEPAPKEITRLTVGWMRQHPDHNGCIKNGCLLLQGVCPNLSKADRKRLGVVAVLGNVLASDTLDMDVKEAADVILEKQIK